MPRRKHKKITEAMTLPNVIPTETLSAPIDWSGRFGNAHPLILELGCGTGQYTLSLAEAFPENNYIGVDVKGARIWQGAKEALEKKLDNVLFLRGGIERIETYFSPESVAEIWITFPDPFPRQKQAKHRLTSPLFLERYKKILRSNGALQLKTDDPALFAYTLETLEGLKMPIENVVRDIYKECPTDPTLTIQTTYEKRHLAAGKTIMYVRWRFPSTR